ncbi:MAG: DUF1523 family protein [Pseudomonadota bacterium]
MRYVKWTFIALIVFMVVAVFHYTLPQRDIVRIVNTYEERQDFGWNSIFWAGPNAGAASAPNRDVLFIQTVRANGNPMVYRNEDTGWGWPPYFKFDTANLQTEAADAVSSRTAPEWYAVTHYGWRSELFSSFPNAVRIRPVANPDVTLIPWFNIIFFVLLAAFLFWLWRIWVRFRERRIDPVLEDIDEASDEVRSRATGWWRRLTGR